MADLTFNDYYKATGAVSFNAVQYHFDKDGLLDDPRLPEYVQGLRVNQLQTYLNGDSPNVDLIELLQQDINGTGAGWFPDGDSRTNDTLLGSVPNIIWLAGLGVIGILLVRGRG